MTVNLGFLAKEASTSTGTGALNLGGAATVGGVTFRTLVSAIGDGNACCCVITDGTDHEVAVCTVSSGSPDSISRDRVIFSTNGNAKVNWSAGTRDVYVIMPPEPRAAAEAVRAIANRVIDKSAAHTVLAADRGALIDVNTAGGNVTITLPSAATVGENFSIGIRKATADGNTVTVDGDGSETIDGATTKVIGGQFASAWLVSDGTGWRNLFASAIASALISDATAAGLAILTAADVAAQRTALGLGTAALKAFGISANQLVELDGSAKLPAVDGSQLTGISTPTAASQAEQEAGTEAVKYVAPATQQHHKSAAKAWGYWTGGGTPALQSDYGISSITDNGTGDYTFNWSTAFSSDKYAVVANGGDAAGGTTVAIARERDTRTAGSARFQFRDGANTASDVAHGSIIAFGDQ